MDVRIKVALIAGIASVLVAGLAVLPHVLNRNATRDDEPALAKPPISAPVKRQQANPSPSLQRKVEQSAIGDKNSVIYNESGIVESNIK